MGAIQKRRSSLWPALILAALLAGVLILLLKGPDQGPRGEAAVGVGAEQAGSRKGRVRRGPKGPPGRRGKRGRRGPAGPQGATGPRGAAGANNERLYNLNVDWSNSADAPGNDSAARSIPGIGTLRISCPTSDPFTYPGDRRLTLSNETGGSRVVATLTSFLDDSSGGENVLNERITNPPQEISFGLPQNGMISGNLSVEPISGSGESPGSLTNASLLLTSSYQTNDPDNPGNNWCHVSAQLVVKGAP